MLDAVREVQDPKEAILRAFHAIEASAVISENLVRSVGTLEDKMDTWESVRSRHPDKKPLSESKCVSNLKTLGSDKAEFKPWNDKLINALAQTLGTPWRRFMKNLNKTLDQDRKVLTSGEIEGIEASEVDVGSESSESIFYVLVEKTEGDAALRVSSGEPG